MPEHVRAYERGLGVRIALSTHRADGTDIALLSSAVDTITAVGLRHGGLATLDMARAQQMWADDMMARADGEPVRSMITVELARLTGRYAWCLADAGRLGQAKQVYASALNLAADDRTISLLLTIDLAAHELRCAEPRAALRTLAHLGTGHPALMFSAYAVRARAYALVGDSNRCRRDVGRADDEWSEVDVHDLPRALLPFASGHAGHAHHAAGKALHELSQRGHPDAAQRAVERLEAAVGAFGPERARAADRCRARLAALRYDE